MRMRVGLFLALLELPLLATAQTRASRAADAEVESIDLDKTPRLEELSRLYPNGGGTAYIDMLRGIRQGKVDSKDCIELVNRESAQAVLEVVDREGPVTWTFPCPTIPCSGYARN